MFTVNFEFDKDGYFFPPDPSKVGAEEEKVTAGGKEAKWSIPGSYVKTNIYRLMDHPNFQPLLESRAKLLQNFKAAKSDEAKDALQNFMKTIIDVLTDVISLTHAQYWKDVAGKIRSPYTFDECIKKAADFGREKLEVLNLISDTQTSFNITSTVINRELDEIARNRMKQLGVTEDRVMSKKGKKGKKSK